MSKKLLTLLALVLAMSVVMAGCGGGGTSSSAAPETSTDAPSTDSPSTPEAPVEAGDNYTGPAMDLTLLTGASGGTYFALGGTMATAWGNHIDNISVSAVSTGASVENINLLNAGEADLGMAMNSIADAGWNGNDPFPEPAQNFRTLGVVYHEVYQMVAAASTGAQSFSDLAGLRVAIGPVGSGGAVASEMILGINGMTLSDVNAERDSFSDAVTKIQDGHLDACASVLTVPASAIVELETSVDINYIDISDEELAEIQKDYPFYSRFVVEPGVYKNTEPFNTITCEAALYCRADLDEEVAYWITKMFYESAEEIAAAHTAGNDIDLQGALNGITTPVHKGAARYYEEQGITVPAELLID